MGLLKILFQSFLSGSSACADAAARNRLRQRCGTAACALENADSQPLTDDSSQPDEPVKRSANA